MPDSHVHTFFLYNAIFVQSLDEEINVVFDKRLVIGHSPVAEAVRTLTSYLSRMPCSRFCIITDRFASMCLTAATSRLSCKAASPHQLVVKGSCVLADP